jgi:hypothetical protein
MSQDLLMDHANPRGCHIHHDNGALVARPDVYTICGRGCGDLSQPLGGIAAAKGSGVQLPWRDLRMTLN